MCARLPLATEHVPFHTRRVGPKICAILFWLANRCRAPKLSFLLACACARAPAFHVDAQGWRDHIATRASWRYSASGRGVRRCRVHMCARCRAAATEGGEYHGCYSLPALLASATALSACATSPKRSGRFPSAPSPCPDRLVALQHGWLSFVRHARRRFAANEPRAS